MEYRESNSERES